MRITSRPYNNKPSHLELDPSVKLISKRRSPQAGTEFSQDFDWAELDWAALN